jgi:hypothetical protein
MSELYKNAIVHLPDGRKITIQKMIDVITLKGLTPNTIQWIELMVNARLAENKAGHALEIKPGYSDFIYRQIIFYAIDGMLGDSEGLE